MSHTKPETVMNTDDVLAAADRVIERLRIRAEQRCHCDVCIKGAEFDAPNDDEIMARFARSVLEPGDEVREAREIVEAALIPCHVTLTPEDERAAWTLAKHYLKLTEPGR